MGQTVEVEHSKSKSTQPSPRAEGTPCTYTYQDLGSVFSIHSSVRTPFQRRQADAGGRSSSQIVRAALQNEGFVTGLYRGFGTTVLREIPFSVIQFPLWEFFKKSSAFERGEITPAAKSALCGSAAGAIAAAATTPLDVAKTRIMLSESGSEMARRASAVHAMRCVWREGGLGGLFAGILPRTLLISFGGAIFFGMYEEARSLFGTLLS